MGDFVTIDKSKKKRDIFKHPFLLTVFGAMIVGGFSMYGPEIKNSINNFFSSTLALTGVSLAVFSVISDIFIYMVVKK